MQIIKLPEDSKNLWLNGDHHAFAWRFYNQFGWFPDRDDCSINADNHGWWIAKKEKISNEQIKEIYQYCDDKTVYQMPDNTNDTELFELNLDWENVTKEINDYLGSKKADYIGRGTLQNIFFHCKLSEEQKINIRNIFNKYIIFK